MVLYRNLESMKKSMFLNGIINKNERKYNMGFFDKLKQGLGKTKTSFDEKINNVFSTFRKVDENFLEELEEALIMSDIGVETSVKIVDKLRTTIKRQNLKDEEEVKNELRKIMQEILDEIDHNLHLDTKPSVILVVGVNGVGKTTSIGKIANRLRKDGKKVVVAAADTFRAAAVEQLEIWSQRSGAEIVKREEGRDPASVVFDAIKRTREIGADVLIVDTAGRLHNKIGLMNELSKIKKVLQKLMPEAPQEVLLVLDASTGQNAIEQAKQFTAATEVNALALTKLDGTAKGGVIIGISDMFKIPVRYIGLGEKAEDLQIFNREAFVETLFANNN